ncbi:hypothetical protein Poly51_55830 [Rubripirellula tenax]|nr:hypothetical protein Poly51_55830 [Rubripirellula tenax]
MTAVAVSDHPLSKRPDRRLRSIAWFAASLGEALRPSHPFVFPLHENTQLTHKLFPAVAADRFYTITNRFLDRCGIILVYQYTRHKFIVFDSSNSTWSSDANLKIIAAENVGGTNRQMEPSEVIVWVR